MERVDGEEKRKSRRKGEEIVEIERKWEEMIENERREVEEGKKNIRKRIVVENKKVEEWKKYFDEIWLKKKWLSLSESEEELNSKGLKDNECDEIGMENEERIIGKEIIEVERIEEIKKE